MLSRKSIILAAALSSIPLVAAKGATITYTYESFQYSLNQGTTWTPVTGTISGSTETVNVPVGAIVQTGIAVTVTNNPTPTAVTTGGYASAGSHAGFVPSNLGIASFGFGFTANSNGAWDAGGLGSGNFVPSVSSTEFNGGPTGTGVDGATATPANPGGISQNSLSGNNTPQTDNSTTIGTQISYGAGSAAELVGGLAFDALGASGTTAQFTPIYTGLTPGQTADAYWVWSSKGTGTTSTATNAPVFKLQDISSSDTVNALPTLDLVIGGGSVATGTNKIISLGLTGTALTGTTPPNGYENYVGLLTSKGGSLSNVLTPNNNVGFANLSGGTANGYVLLALNLGTGVLTPAANAAQIAQIVTDINNSNSSVGAIAISSTPGQPGFPFYQFDGGATQYDIAIPVGSNPSTFAYDFSNVSPDTTDPDTTVGTGQAGSAVTVTAIAAVPEPATAAGVILGAAGLLLGRRKNRAVA
jgi:hypothetical protein